MNPELETIKQEVDKDLSEIRNSTIPNEPPNMDVGWTVDINEWLDNTKKYLSVSGTVNDLNFDYEIIKNAKAYLLGPVFSYKGKVDAASSLTHPTLAELKAALEGRQYLLYMLLTNVKTGKFNAETFTMEPLDEPEISYIFRGCILE